MGKLLIAGFFLIAAAALIPESNLLLSICLFGAGFCLVLEAIDYLNEKRNNADEYRNKKKL